MYRLIPPMLLLCGTSVLATTVYKTVDAKGVVSFSDTPQEEDAEELTISTSAPQSPEDHLANLEAMRETTDRMAEDRREREKHRAELKELAARNRAPQPPQQNYSDYYYPINSGNYRRRGRPPYHPGYGPGPEHPIAHPPLLPNGGTSRSSNSQLMRPMVSSRR